MCIFRIFFTGVYIIHLDHHSQTPLADLTKLVIHFLLHIMVLNDTELLLHLERN